MRLFAAGLLLIPMSYCDTPARTTPDSREEVNALDYGYLDIEPAMQAYRLVAADMGETDEQIEAWAPFVYDVIAKESGGCWNLKRRQIPVVGECLTFQSNPRRTGSDSGFGQVTAVWYKGPRAPLCKGLGLCSQAAVLESPYTSMQSLVFVLQHSGKQPWCFNAWARKFHKCKLAPAGKL